MTAGSTVPNLSSRTDQQTLSTHQRNTSFKGKYESKDSCEETNIDQLAKDLVSKIDKESYCQEVSDSLNEESEETVNIIQESVKVSWFQLQLIRTSRAKRTDYQQLRRSVHQDDGDLCSLLFEDPSLYSDSDLKDRIYLELL
ncbi:uncharacterized protein LOC111696992 [Eurytemora carolleeae]|uniref:uncharacterized protein LOC111696992 n=1 Tax=Eurytemora carolleeae TaxID=1294199 RepID=UPI000C762CF2|nr:uncharacterized protein LOC111696992 [Eurytemora carolleeae]|eukprot:XP_023322610.1 uncharacterized protein LOC111696992 [Eurytemora affinis]